MDFFDNLVHFISFAYFKECRTYMIITIIKKQLRRRKIYLNLLKWSILFSLLALIFSHVIVEKSTSKLLYSSVDSIPENHVGLLLGTNKYLTNGNINLYYKYRISAASELFKKGKVDYIIVSGDNSVKNYNEPVQMRDDLIRNGVPPKRIILDYAGFRTLDSVVRSKEVFGQTNITIISQPFHNKRAVFIAKNKNINAIGFNAREVQLKYGIKVQIRELFARVKLMIDLYLISKDPKFLGKKIIIPS